MTTQPIADGRQAAMSGGGHRPAARCWPVRFVAVLALASIATACTVVHPGATRSGTAEGDTRPAAPPPTGGATLTTDRAGAPVASSAPRAPVSRDDLRGALLVVDDLPPGWHVQIEPRRVPPAERHDPDTEEAEAHVSFRRGDLAPSEAVYQDVLLFRPGAARVYMDQRRADPKAGEPSGVSVTPFTVPPLGDDTIAVALRFGQGVFDALSYQVWVRRGDAVAVVRYSETAVEPMKPRADPALVERLAQVAAARLAAIPPLP